MNVLTCVEKCVGVAPNPCVPGDRLVKQQDQAAYWSSTWDQSLRACVQMASKILIALKLQGLGIFFCFFFFGAKRES